MTDDDLIRRRIEQFAPGFTDTIVAARGPPLSDYEAYNPNYVGGDIASGALTPRRQNGIRTPPDLSPNPQKCSSEKELI